MPRKKAYSTAEAAGLLDCSAPAVIRWIEEGKLKAYRTPGGHRRILKKDLEVFAREFGFPLTRDAAESYNVLVIDDEPEVLKLVEKGLSHRLPFLKIDTAADGISGLIKFGQMQPDLLLLDLKMPGVDGFDVIRKILDDPRSGTTKLLVVSGHLGRANRKKLKDLGIEEIITKPFNMDQLAEKVDNLLRA